MNENLQSPNEEERLRDENAFLKLKLMLEHGASLSEKKDTELPAEIENLFLKQLMAFEEKFEERKEVKVIEKIGNPKHFKPHTEISDEEIGRAWEELRMYMNEYDVDLDACSPNITSRELYRFTTEELFQHEMDDLDMPGWVTHFVYDEFYPDLVYDNTQTATRDCLERIFSIEPLEWMHPYQESGILFNTHRDLTRKTLQLLVNRFKECYDAIELTATDSIHGTLENNHCTIRGKYAATARSGQDQQAFGGSWKVSFIKMEEAGNWYIHEVQVEGLML